MILKGESPAQTGGSLTLRSHSSRQWRCTRSRHFQSSGALVSVPQVVFAPTLEICATLCLIQQHNTNHLLRSQLQLPSFDLPQRSYTHTHVSIYSCPTLPMSSLFPPRSSCFTARSEVEELWAAAASGGQVRRQRRWKERGAHRARPRWSGWSAKSRRWGGVSAVARDLHS